MFLYLTADASGHNAGGARVVLEESQALRELSAERGEEFRLVSRPELLEALAGAPSPPPDPWQWDYVAHHMFGNRVKLCHLYAGTFGESVKKLKSGGARVTYTVAAHDREVSRREHENLGVDFAKLYPHLVDPVLWDRYIAGYRGADVIVCPGAVPATTVRRYGVEFTSEVVEVIPHGTDLPDSVTPPPAQFVVGYLGAVGLDKGLRYLFAAWKKLAYKDALLVIAGRDSTSPFVRELWNVLGGGNVIFTGWVGNVSDFYNSLSLYVQPSATEGWGIECVEAMAHGRPVLCSEGAGAVDAIKETGYNWHFPACDPDALAQAIDGLRSEEWCLGSVGLSMRRVAEKYAWPLIRDKYKAMWRRLLDER